MAGPVPRRDRRGRWTVGSSGNPAGRPPVLDGVRAMARAYSVDAVRALVAILEDPASSRTARVAAARLVLGWALGRAGAADRRAVALAELDDAALDLVPAALVALAAPIVADGG